MITKHKSEEGLEYLQISNESGTAIIYLQGAHLTEWNPQGTEPVIWMSKNSLFEEGKAIRGGVPLCWPWFGPQEGRQTHGFARNLIWKFDEHYMPSPSEDILKFSLETSDESLGLWPFRFKLIYTVSIGRLLGLSLATTNMDKVDYELTQAIHTYFQISDIADISIHGLEGCNYFDKTDAFALKLNEGDFTFSKEVDAVFLSQDSATIHDPNWNRDIQVNKSRDSTETVVWNPGETKSKALPDMEDLGYKTMVCVEAANTGEGKILLSPGESTTIYQLISAHSRVL